MDTGHYISGIGHASLLGWALIGGLFSSVPEDNLKIAEVSIISEQEFAALSTPVSTPDAPQEPAADVTPEPEPTPPASEPETPPPAKQEPEEIQPPTPIESTPKPVEPEPTPEPPAPPAPDQPVVLAPPAVTSSSRPARRVAPTPVAPPPPDTEVAEQTNEQTTPDEAAPTQEESKPATAPEEATDRIVTEADAPAASAMKSSARPRSRPARLAAPTPPADTSSNSTQDAIAAALAGVQADDNASPTSSAPTGPPLTGGEKDAFLVDVRRCWNVGALSTDALESKVVVRFELSREGKPDKASIKMTGFEGGSQAGAKQAYEAARRAIIRCGASGYNLPIDKYEQWKIVNITFNPENMRLK